MEKERVGNSDTTKFTVAWYADQWVKHTAKKKQWFIDHIGIKIYPSNPICQCDICAKHYESGYIMDSIEEADDMYANEIAAWGKHFLRQWFDNKEERDSFVEKLSKKE
jgi:hypothetical protein